MLKALTKFKQREGHLIVPKHYVEDGKQLGRWIYTQRTQKRKGALCHEEERRLNEIGFIWNVNEKWETMVAALTQFKQREGHCDVTRKHVEHLEGGVKIKLGDWLVSQRYQRRCGTLNTKREQRLESLGVKWHNQRQEIAEEHFDRYFGLLLVFKEREGHVRVPLKHQESANDYLGVWLGKQRHRHRNGRLELDRQKWLEVAGVTWGRQISSQSS
jgi:hypothetical protein